MNEEGIAFNRKAVRPMVCLREGWQLIKNDYWLFLGISFVGILFGSMAPMGLLIGPAMCGIYVCLLRRERGMRISFDMLFRGFDYFVQSLLATLIIIVPQVIVIVLLYGLMIIAFIGLTAQQPQNAPPDPIFLWTIAGIMAIGIVCIVGMSVLLSALFLFTYPLIVDRELTGVEAVKTSLRAAWGNLGGVLSLTLLTTLLSLAGVLACYVGAFFVLPLYYAMIVIAYRQVFPREVEPDLRLPRDPLTLPSTSITTSAPPSAAPDLPPTY